MSFPQLPVPPGQARAAQTTPSRPEDVSLCGRASWVAATRGPRKGPWPKGELCDRCRRLSEDRARGDTTTTRAQPRSRAAIRACGASSARAWATYSSRRKDGTSSESPTSNSGPLEPSGEPLSAARGTSAAAPLGAESGRDHRHAHLITELIVDHGAEDDVRVLVGRAGDDLRRLVHLEQAEIRRAR